MSEEQTETQEEQTIEVPQEYADERPEWLPEKFNSPEDLASSYTNLESKIGQKEEEIRNAVMEEIQAEAYSERPAEVGDYILPDVIDDEAAKDNDLLNWWADHSFENGFSQKEFEEGIMMFHEAVNDGYNVEYEMQELGYNYRMSDLHASLGLSQLQRIGDFLKIRKEIALYYIDKLKSLPLRMPPYSADSAWHLFVCHTETSKKRKIRIKCR